MKPQVFKSGVFALLLVESLALASQNPGPFSVSVVQDTLKNSPSLTGWGIEGQPDYVVGFIESLRPVAEAEMNKYHIPASVILAQAILESGYGESALAKNACNYFGIKANRKEKETYVYDGDVYRSYRDVETCFDDHSKFLLEKPVFKNLISRGDGLYTSWIYGLDAACYAEDPEYVCKLRTIIERLELYRLDEFWRLD